MHPLTLPPELWVEIFSEFDGRFDRTDLSAVVATCRTFAHIARPLHLTKFTFRPYGLKYDPAHPDDPEFPDELCIPAERADRERSEAHFEFWTSEAVAPLIG
ncbi:F-box domain-containing protein [Mycena chlorophos]|uniref:F-box domain-containing protein n=1 Tax=Mycena chlorophos TaxID=658473 RepID=A0A8H6SAA8_MYCCL|nr:F-box domain-containing protein [Mycena chlorophos]